MPATGCFLPTANPQHLAPNQPPQFVSFNDPLTSASTHLQAPGENYVCVTAVLTYPVMLMAFLGLLEPRRYTSTPSELQMQPMNTSSPLAWSPLLDDELPIIPCLSTNPPFIPPLSEASTSATTHEPPAFQSTQPFIPSMNGEDLAVYGNPFTGIQVSRFQCQ